jgi:hypothetical protein
MFLSTIEIIIPGVLLENDLSVSSGANDDLEKGTDKATQQNVFINGMYGVM